MLGMELTRPGREIVNQCLVEGVIINCTAGNILRFVPPLNISTAHIDELVDILDRVLNNQ
jgi:acetylornithine/N-succinyldiaminopimelate aminotransferase